MWARVFIFVGCLATDQMSLFDARPNLVIFIRHPKMIVFSFWLGFLDRILDSLTLSNLLFEDFYRFINLPVLEDLNTRFAFASFLGKVLQWVEQHLDLVRVLSQLKVTNTGVSRFGHSPDEGADRLNFWTVLSCRSEILFAANSSLDLNCTPENFKYPTASYSKPLPPARLTLGKIACPL